MKGSVRTDTIRTRTMLISKRWVQAVAVVMLFGFFVLGLLAYRTYTDQAPIPGKVVRHDGQVLFTRGDVVAGQKIFLRNGLMEYGSIFGHGAYLGPDFTADYLRRWAVLVADHDRDSGSESAKADTLTTFKTNRFDPATDTLEFTAAQGEAFETLQKHYSFRPNVMSLRTVFWRLYRWGR